MGKLVELKDIKHRYDGDYVLKGINLEIDEGKILSIIGHNGAGKTTLLRILAMLEKPSSGNVLYRDYGVKEHNLVRLRREITMVFQLPVLFNTTVFNNIAYGLRLRERSSEKVFKKVEDALKAVGLTNFSRRRAMKLSGGEQQRVILARALALEPRLLLLDEPTANLDPSNILIVENIIKKLKGRTTAVVATHNMFQARRISDKVGCLLNGVLIDIGKTNDLFNHPKDERTKRFIGGELF